MSSFETLAGIGILWWLIAGLLAILWAFLPFAIYGTQSKIESLNTRLGKLIASHEKLLLVHEKTNEKLEALYEEAVMLRQQQLEISVRQSNQNDYE